MRSHAAQRAFERYGEIDLARSDMAEAIQAIRLEKPTALWLESLDASADLYAVRIKRRWLAAVYANQLIVTFRDPRCLEPHKAAIWERKQELRLLEYQGAAPH